ncbi:MAG: RcnB family protein [Ottowia sp.]|nr:RcnB family protein [Ottowia sp.]
MNRTTTTIRRVALLCALGCALAQPALAADHSKHRRVAPPPVARHHAAPPVRHAAPVRHIAPPARYAALPPRRVAPPVYRAAPPVRPVVRAPAHRWQRGHWVPPHARRPVNNWRVHSLPPPAWGHQWVQLDGGSFAQIALSTGLITLIVNA